MTTAEAYDAVVLAGGSARRLGGADKPGLPVGGLPMLDRVLTGCARAGRTVVVGPERATVRPVRWVREQPPGGGPVAAIAAALPQIGAATVLLLAADLPFFDAATAARLCAAVTPEVAAAVLVDADGREQPLAAAYRTDALRAALDQLPEPSGLPLRRLVGGLPTRQLPDREGAATDCDTWDALDHARARADRSASGG
ncbi:molybdenum cofactor guanylyltransferase [Streptacidiphilus sp. P02-A3a]|uniref:molybdenum cofactor guanylyltransferase n=1 Tax=Streptacidiphilus sp. P02-A3a TaxID=2704468 RepID=UPI0015F97761|nr:NTP transferase domain-containing protein [Streptacidiphilus sp. P02-A3a]